MPLHAQFKKRTDVTGWYCERGRNNSFLFNIMIGSTEKKNVRESVSKKEKPTGRHNKQEHG